MNHSMTVVEGTPRTHKSYDLSFKELCTLLTPEEYKAISDLSVSEAAVFQALEIAKNTNPLDMNDTLMVSSFTYIGTLYDGAGGYPLDAIPTPARIATILEGVPL